MPSFRALVLAVVVALAGCTAAPVADDAEPVTTTTPATTSETPTPKPLPEPPDELTRESVTEFVVAHEEALLYNREIAGNDRVNVGCEVRSANRTGDGFRVRVGCGISTYDYLPEEDVTAHGDGFSRATYLVNESDVDRTPE